MRSFATKKFRIYSKSHDSSYKHVFTSRRENSVDPDQLVSQKPADPDQELHCFQNMIHLGSAW